MTPNLLRLLACAAFPLIEEPHCHCAWNWSRSTSGEDSHGSHLSKLPDQMTPSSAGHEPRLDSLSQSLGDLDPASF